MADSQNIAEVCKNLFFILWIYTGTGSGDSYAQESRSQTITLLHTNDFHGNYMPFHAVKGSATSQTGDPGADSLITFPMEAEIGGLAVLS